MTILSGNAVDNSKRKKNFTCDSIVALVLNGTLPRGRISCKAPKLAKRLARIVAGRGKSDETS